MKISLLFSMETSCRVGASQIFFTLLSVRKRPSKNVNMSKVIEGKQKEKCDVRE